MSGARVLGLGNRLRKLRAMSPAELIERVRYRAFLEIERRQHASGSPSRPQPLPAPLRTAKRRSQARFFPSAAQRDAMRALFDTRYPAELAASLDHAERARQHRFEFFGREFSYGDVIPWQADPVSGRPWPAVYHADVPVHGGDTGFGDVKHVWELNRQQFTMDLGKAWFLTGDKVHLEALERLVRSWIEGNPYGTGVNWACSLEPAFRVFSWLWAYHLSAGDLEDDFHLAWLGSFREHGRFIAHHLEYYSSPYNHLIAEAVALYMVGIFFPEFPEARSWKTKGLAVMTRRLGDQFYSDGGSVEQSTFYHHATIGFYLLAMLSAKTAGEELPAPILAAIERGLEYSSKLSQPDGSTPRIGGADDGKPIRLEHLPFWDFRPYLAIGAVVFARPDFKAVAGRFYEDALWLLGPQGLTAFDAMESREPDYTSTSLAASGYYIMRSDWSPRADYVCVDCGEQAAGMRPDAVPNSMHGHADCLSAILWLRGRATLVDSGLFGYNCGGAWEDHFRETAAHNTARVDGKDQATHLRKMAWSYSYRAALETWSAGSGQAWMVGSHDGYDREPDGVRHRRAVWLRPEHYVLIYDEFVGAGRHDLDVNWQFAAGALAQLPGTAALFENEIDVAWMSRSPWTASISHGGTGPADGWIAPSLGVRQAAPRLTLTSVMAGARVSLLTVAAARISAGSRVSIQAMGTAADGAALLAVATADGVDLVAARGISDGGPMDTEAPLAVCQVRRGATGPAAFALGGSRVRVDADAIRRLVPDGTPMSR